MRRDSPEGSDAANDQEKSLMVRCEISGSAPQSRRSLELLSYFLHSPPELMRAVHQRPNQLFQKLAALFHGKSIQNSLSDRRPGLMRISETFFNSLRYQPRLGSIDEYS